MGSWSLHRAGERCCTRSAGVRTWHSFSFGPHYDPANTGFGPLVLHDEHLLDAGAGFPPHRHAGVEVVTWVLEGRLVHESATGGLQELGPGDLQHLSAGSGTVHAERAGGVPTRFVQAWLLGDGGSAPSYEVVRGAGPDAPLAPVRAVGASVLSAGVLAPGERVVRGRAHLWVAAGAVEVAGVGRLGPGDALRSAAGELVLQVPEPARVLLWTLRPEE